MAGRHQISDLESWPPSFTSHIACVRGRPTARSSACSTQVTSSCKRLPSGFIGPVVISATRNRAAPRSSGSSESDRSDRSCCWVDRFGASGPWHWNFGRNRPSSSAHSPSNLASSGLGCGSMLMVVKLARRSLPRSSSCHILQTWLTEQEFCENAEECDY